MLQGEHSAILLTFIKLPFVIKIFVLSIFSGRFTQVLLYMFTSLAVMVDNFERSLKQTDNWFSRPISTNVGQKYCRMLQGEHSAILSTFIKLPFVIKIFVLSIFEWQFYTGFTVNVYLFSCHGRQL